MKHRVATFAYRLFGLLPWPLQRLAIALARPAFVIGSTAVVVADDGSILLVRHTYKPGWSTPGGFVDRDEGPADAVVREVWEECGLRVEAEGEPATMVRGDERIVEFIFRCRLADGVAKEAAHATSAEIAEVAWFAQGRLPTDLTRVAYNGVNGLADAETDRVQAAIVSGSRRLVPISGPPPPSRAGRRPRSG